jgi:putative endonuclease
MVAAANIMACWERESRTFYVYIMGSKAGVLYIGVTNDLERRVNQHREGLIAGFTRHIASGASYISKSSTDQGMQSLARNRSRVGRGQENSD